MRMRRDSHAVGGGANSTPGGMEVEAGAAFQKLGCAGLIIVESAPTTTTEPRSAGSRFRCVQKAAVLP